ncbi:MAG: alpha-glucosidase [Phycisphaerae bacterium]
MFADRTVRFRDPAHAASELPPFPAYLSPPRESGPAPATFPVRVRFADKDGLRHAWIKTDPGTTLYGTGEIAGPLARNGRVTVCWNTDQFDYTDRSRSLYQSHPFVLGVRRDGSAFGVICETTYWCRIDLRRGILFSARGPSPAVTVIDRASPQEVVRALSDLTGRMPMPPRWALGYHQCRWSYEPAARVREIAEGFRSRRIPCDAIWLDIDYMHGFRCFTFDHEKFHDPAGLNADLKSQGFHTVYMIDPGIKVDHGYAVYDAGRAGSDGVSHFVQDARGHEHHGSVWPGPCAFPDYTSAAVRRWWAGLWPEFLRAGADGIWNDMNEPAIFDGPGKSMPVTRRHHADPDLGGPGDHRRYHNIYGMQMVRATREGMAAARPGRRLFILTRSNFLGGQRYAATWTGDNRSNWAHLRWSIPMALNLSLSGQPMVGPDIGGFVGDATPELFARFMGIGSLLPFARGHSIKGSRDHEPWSFGPECEHACRLALRRRYRLMPYLYTVCCNAALTGEPIVRPVFWADTANPGLRTIDHAFLLGPDVIVVASVDPARAEPGPSPIPGWREFECADPDDDGVGGIGRARAHEQLPRLFLRPGAVIPLAPAAEHTGAMDLSRLTLVAAIEGDRAAIGSLRTDDGESLDHMHGAYFNAELSVSRGPQGPVGHVVALHEEYRARVGIAAVAAVDADGSVTIATA